MESLTLSTWPSFTDFDVSSVCEVLLSGKVNYWTGEQIKLFEQEFADWIGVEHALSVMNGSIALELALTVAGIGPNDKVVVPARSFVATASSVVNVGATPIFADVELESGNIDPLSLRAVITEDTKAVICVHLGGWPCQMDEIMDIARESDLVIIEDCAQAHGAIYKGKKVGSIGHIGAWSFCQDKIMTTGGEGGMLTLNSTDWYYKLWSLREHGKNPSICGVQQFSPEFQWTHTSFGSNFRMTEIQAVLGRNQLRIVDDWVNRRNKNAKQLNALLDRFINDIGLLRAPVLSCENCRISADGLAVEICEQAHTKLGCRHAYYRSYFYIRPENLGAGWTRSKIIEELRGLGVPCSVGSCPEIYLEKAFQNSNMVIPRKLPNASILGETSICFLVHPTLTESQISEIAIRICNVLEKVICDSGS